MGKTILVVDDSAIMRKMIKTTLQAANHKVIGEARNGNDAVALYKEMKPDVVTMDITMQGMDGLSAAAEIMRYDRAANIIFLSNLNEIDYTANAQRLGAKGYLNKHSTEQILALIEQL
jgi:two-component system chemotaxis response regulator CheY